MFNVIFATPFINTIFTLEERPPTVIMMHCDYCFDLSKSKEVAVKDRAGLLQDRNVSSVEDVMNYLVAMTRISRAEADRFNTLFAKRKSS